MREAWQKEDAVAFETVVIGGGIVGLATAHALLGQNVSDSVALLEKEPSVAMHQSGRNSGVIHSGLYYRPGSLKATLCRTGREALVDFCLQAGVAVDICGKVVVAVDERELPRLEDLRARGGANGLAVERIDAGQLRDLEPAARGHAALRVPEAGIVDYPGVCRALAQQIAAAGGTLRLGTAVQEIAESGNELQLKTTTGMIRCRRLINCAGLHSDTILAAMGQRPPVRIMPFRGEYYELTPARSGLCRNLIYPVPDPRFPFLGVHLTRMIGGGVECGPNAVLALAKEGYDWRSVSPRELSRSLLYPGFRRFAMRNFSVGVAEVYRSFSKRAFARSLQRLVPAVTPADLVRGRSGVRAQAVTPRGEFVDDFVIETTGNAVHVLNAPSPAATASLAIAREIVNRFAACT